MSTVQVRVIGTRWIPCETCKWFTNCVVPKGRHLKKSGRVAVKIVYECKDYTKRGR